MTKAASLSGSSLIARKRTAEIPDHVATSGNTGKPVAMTLKLDQGRYEAFKALQAKQRKSGQQILIEALDSYLQAFRNNA